MKGISEFLRTKEDVQSVIDGITNGLGEQLLAGLSGSSRSLLIATLQEALDRPILLITHHLTQAQQLYDDLSELSSDQEIYLYPVNELIATEMAIASPELKMQRIASLTNWLQKEAGILIVPVAALKRILPPVSYWEKYQLSFVLGKQINVEDKITALVEMGFEQVKMVTAPGEFSRRGGIIDIYAYTEEHPLRIELFDDEIDSIRLFDPESQRSIKNESAVRIGPATEVLLTDEDMVRGADRIQKALAETLKSMNDTTAKEQLIENIDYDLERINNFERFEKIHKYLSLLYDNPASLLDYLPANSLVILDETSRIQEVAHHLDEEEAEWYTSLLEARQMIAKTDTSFDWTEIWRKMDYQRLYLSVFLRHIPNTEPANIVNFSSREMQEFHGQMNLFKNELERWEENEFSVIILAPNVERSHRIQSILRDYDIQCSIVEALDLPLKGLSIVVGNMRAGIEFPLYKLVFITENELFKRKTSPVRSRQKISNAERIQSYQELKIGDYVVHANHGIGQYLGIETVKVQEIHKDYLLIKYRGDDKLYVPVDQIGLVQKFVGSEGKTPRVYKLGGSEWTRVKSRVQSSIKDIADELIKLYAEREAKKGFAFSPDTDLQRDFELAFPYRETEDQLKCVEEIKEDMERERPMDRLLCGDVGYGKTEVAIRAAFKAISDGKQVALLVPTTILAQQHYQTFLERFHGFPIEIGLLSRFRTAKQQRESLEELEKGNIDIMIGTHRLLSKDVKYKDLGLLIVDEEQRFGVQHKEKIKQIKTNVDVLTLTATPIPRTLHMSMIGVRDLSVIETPPENRFPVQTYVLEYNPMYIREAIEREMSRNGQVFFLYNRVENIERVAREIGMLVEDARIAVAHGQMNETELENIMFGFLEGEYDVLVSTTIIETGVDIPNVNTLIVYDADRMGLGQLYQLRGRVGRSNRVAYAHFTYQPDKVLTEVAEKRLQAIKEFTELGSGFKLAMRDLTLRGAGNLLGAQQHGFIDSVGFDMYSQMLKEAIEEQKDKKETAVPEIEPKLMLEIDAYIPESYIPDEVQKIDMYKRFQSLETVEEIEDLTEELIDRYGDFPKEVSHLFSVAKIKIFAQNEQVESVQEKRNKITMIITEERSQKIDGAKLFQLAHDYDRSIQLGTAGNQLQISYQWTAKTKDQRYEIVADFMKKLAQTDRDE